MAASHPFNSKVACATVFKTGIEIGNSFLTMEKCYESILGSVGITLREERNSIPQNSTLEYPNLCDLWTRKMSLLEQLSMNIQ